GVFQTDIQPNPEIDDSWTNIYYDLMADENAQQSQMVALSPEEFEEANNRYFPLNTLYDTVAYRRATKDLNDDLAKKVDEMTSVFKESRIPVQMITTDNKTTVAIVFERVNQRGVPLDTLQLLTAWTWSEDFDLQSRFQDLSEELEPFGFKDVGEDSNLLLRCCAAVIKREASTETLIELTGETIRGHFDNMINGLKGAIDFLQKNLNVHSLQNLPYPSMLIPLSAFFAIPGNEQFRQTDEQTGKILRWFWKVCFSKRYNSQPIKTIKNDIAEMIRLRENRQSELGEFSINLTSEFFKKEAFRMSNVSTKTFILMLAQERPKSFISGLNVDLGKVLKDYNKNEFHHLYPKNFLRSNGYEGKIINCLANLCFMSKTDNNQLGGVAPSEYREKMPENIDEILRRAVCPTSLFENDFDKFINERIEMLFEKASSLTE
ncbi:MAG TPA: hypothetical protein VK892_09735, partial [Pyrinomonadaceae bacterium]|nr:hypothetical protein [Pyrinomonadaceae bacterium]